VLLDSPARASYVNFESVPARPLALSPDGTRLYVTNLPDARLEVFAFTLEGLLHRGSVPVGLDPVAVAARTNGEVWVVNHLSDSVSVVDVASEPPRVVRTLLVGDEPWDVVFAGADPNDPNAPPPRAFVSAARRGQNHRGTPHPKQEQTTPGVGRADVWVFDANALGASPGGDPIAIVQLFGDKPRPLAASPDGATVYAGVFHSGNRTTAVSEGAVCNGGAGAAACPLDGVSMPGGLPGGQAPGGLPAPNQNFQGFAAPEVGLIVKFDAATGTWKDELGRNWTNAVRFSLPDQDVFAIDALATPPVQSAAWATVGTVLFGMAANPASGKLYVANTDARNEVRFEGTRSVGPSTVRGHLHEARVTVIDGATVTARHLNKHIPYGAIPMPADVKPRSLATPAAVAVSADGARVYVAAFGSSKLGVLDAGELETNAFVPDPNDHAVLSGGGPAGLVLDEARDRAYVYTRFDNGLSVIDLATLDEVEHRTLHSPEPEVVTAGRRFLYDASFTSSNGEASCSSCHVFGDLDDLAWDLGDPNGTQVASNPNPFPVIGPIFPVHPMKGPMTTQTLRGMRHHGPMHWRGDRTGATGADPNAAFDESLAFEKFEVAFDGLLGRDAGPLPPADMAAFAGFVLATMLPPNPLRGLDNALTDANQPVSEQRGRDFYFGPVSDGVRDCNGCHVLDPAQGFFGADGGSSFEAETQDLKVPHLRNLYQKVGMFGMPAVGFFLPGDNSAKGAQIRGFGFLHDGSVDTLLRFHRAQVFDFGGDPVAADALRRDMEAFMLAFDSDFAPIVGQQVSLDATSGAADHARVDLLRQRAMAAFVLAGHPGVRECDLIVKGNVGGTPRGWTMTASGSYLDDTGATIADAALRALAGTAGQELSFTCVYPLAGTPDAGDRIGVDRDADGIGDGRECGDVNGDGLDDAFDAPLTRRWLAGIESDLVTLERCNAIGAAGGDAASCTIQDVVVMERHAAGLAPAPAPICGPWL
jgi:YVTN family beta-propeller protein